MPAKLGRPIGWSSDTLSTTSNVTDQFGSPSKAHPEQSTPSGYLGRKEVPLCCLRAAIGAPEWKVAPPSGMRFSTPQWTPSSNRRKHKRRPCRLRTRGSDPSQMCTWRRRRRHRGGGSESAGEGGMDNSWASICGLLQLSSDEGWVRQDLRPVRLVQRQRLWLQVQKLLF